MADENWKNGAGKKQISRRFQGNISPRAASLNLEHAESWHTDLARNASPRATFVGADSVGAELGPGLHAVASTPGDCELGASWISVCETLLEWWGQG